MNFRRAIKKGMKEFGINLDSWMDLARGRMEWRRVVDKGKVANMSEWLDERERKSLLGQIVRTSLRQPQTNVANQGRVRSCRDEEQKCHHIQR